MSFVLGLVAMFKNESSILASWIDHYIKEGVQHFYLIDNGSTDDYQKILDPHMDLITLIKDPDRSMPSPQTTLINKHFKDKVIAECQWVLVCDIDEYVYARNQFNQITDFLLTVSKNVGIICLPWKIFGSNGHTKQPKKIIKSFTQRSPMTLQINLGHCKCIARVTKFLKLDIHVSRSNYHMITTKQRHELLNKNLLWNANCEPIQKQVTCHQYLNLHLNHYMFMSKDYYLKIKCTRGGGENGLIEKYTPDYYLTHEKKHNDILDKELKHKKYKVLTS